MRQKFRESTTRRFRSGEKFGFRTPGVHDRILASKVRNGTVIPNGAGRGICGFRKGIDHYCRSAPEANFARILLLEGIPYEYEPKMFRLSSGRHYTPDFRLLCPIRDLVPAGWVELKGWRKKDGALPDGVEEKVRGFEEVTGEKVHVLTMQDLAWELLGTEYAPRIPLWETPTRNLRMHPKVFGR